MKREANKIIRMSESIHEQIRRKIQTSGRILLTTHLRPDGDAIGSLLGLGLALREAGKVVQMVSADGVPISYRHLSGSQEVIQHPDGEVDMVISLDCSDIQRVGNSLNGYNEPDLNLDHHITNLNFGRLNLVDTKAVATAEILAACLPAW